MDVWMNRWKDGMFGRQADRQVCPEEWIVGCWMDGPVVGGQMNSGWNIHGRLGRLEDG